MNFISWAFLALIIPVLVARLVIGRRKTEPLFLALVLVFWNVHQSRRIGVGVAFIFGLLMDVHSGAVLGQHALAYTLLSFFAVTVHRRLLWFSVPAQALQILPLFVAAHAVSLLVLLATGRVLAAPAGDAVVAASSENDPNRAVEPRFSSGDRA